MDRFALKSIRFVGCREEIISCVIDFTLCFVDWLSAFRSDDLSKFLLAFTHRLCDCGEDGRARGTSQAAPCLECFPRSFNRIACFQCTTSRNASQLFACRSIADSERFSTVRRSPMTADEISILHLNSLASLHFLHGKGSR